MMYKAFISYSHAADGKLAPVFQSALQRFAKPWYRLRGLRAFRDETGLAVTPALWPSIQRALSESEYFILFASPEAAGSHWVEQELQFWLANRPRENILIAWTGGAIMWDDANGDFDANHTTALPPTLQRAFSDEPLYVDLRWAKTEEHLSLGHPTFRDAIAGFAAALYGRPKDEIIGEDVRQHRKTKTVVWSAVLALLSLTVSSLLAANAAIRQRNIAVSRQLAADGQLLVSQQLDLSLLLSVESVNRVTTPEAKRSLLAGVQSNPDVAGFVHHTGNVDIVKFNHDGSSLAVAGDSGVTVWDPRLRTLLANYELPGSNVMSVAFSADGSMLASGTRDGSVVLWRLTDGQRLGESFQAGATVTSLAFSKDGENLAAGLATGRSMVWKTKSREQVGVSFGDSDLPITTIAFDPVNQGRLMTGGIAGVRTWNFTTPQYRTEGKGIPAGSMALSPSGRFIALSEFGEKHKRVIAFDRLSHDQFAGEPPDQVVRLDVADNGKMVSTSVDGNVTAWLPYRETLFPRVLVNGGRPVTSVAISRDGKVIASTSQGFGVTIWSVPGTLRIRKQLPGSPPTLDMAFSSTSTIGVAGSNGTIMNWAIDAGEPVAVARSIPELGDRVAKYSPDGTILASVSKDESLHVWDLKPASGTSKRLTGLLGRVVRLVISSDNRTLAAGTDSGQLLAWKDIAAETSAHVLGTLSDQAEALAIAPSGTLLAAADRSDITYTVGFWDISTGNRMTQLRTGHTFPIQALAFDARGKVLATGSWDKTIRLFDVRTRAARGTPLIGHDETVLELVFSPDGTTLASAGQHSVILWDVTTGSLLGRLSLDDSDEVTDIAFSPDGRYLSAGGPRSAYLWDLSVEEWKRVACQVANRSLTDVERKTYLGKLSRNATCDYSDR
jgi:WD40 repeat protein